VSILLDMKHPWKGEPDIPEMDNRFSTMTEVARRWAIRYSSFCGLWRRWRMLS
jgi:hypothetical protein